MLEGKWKLRRWEPAVGILVLLAGALLRLWGIGSEGLWHDEAITYHLSNVPLAEMSAVFASGEQTPLYPLLLAAWKAVFGISEGALRSLSALWGILAIPLVWWAGREIHSPRAGVWAAALMAASPLAVHYSQELRPYTLLMALGPCAALLALKLRRGGGPLSVLGLGAVFSCLPLTHHIGAFLVFAVAVSACLPWPGGRGAARILGAGLIAALVWGGWTLTSPDPVIRASSRLGIGTMSEGGLPDQTLRSLSSATPGTELPVRNRVREVLPRGWLALVACACLATLGALRWPAQAPAGGRSVVFGAPALYLLLLALAGLLGVPLWIVGRTDSLLLPFLLLAVASGLAAIPGAAALSLGLPLLAMAALPLGQLLTVDFRSQERILSQQVLAHAGGGDVVVTTDNWHAALAYYADRSEDPPEIRTFPRGYERRNRPHDWWMLLDAPLDEASRAYVDALAAEGHETVWLVYDAGGRYESLLRELLERWTPVEAYRAPPPLDVVSYRLVAKGEDTEISAPPAGHR